MVDAARKLLAGLSPSLRARAAFQFDDPARTNWHYYPITPVPRKGAVLKAMTPPEKDLVKNLLRAGTSEGATRPLGAPSRWITSCATSRTPKPAPPLPRLGPLLRLRLRRAGPDRQMGLAD